MRSVSPRASQRPAPATSQRRPRRAAPGNGAATLRRPPGGAVPPALRPAKQRKMLEVLELFRIVFKSARQHYRIVERKTGIGGAQLWALAQVVDSPGIRVGDLAHALAIHQSTASNLLRDLEAAGLLARRKVREDKRTVRLHATPAGLAVLKRAPRPLIGVLQQALADLPSANLDSMHRQLAYLIVLMKAGDDGASTPLSEL